MKSKRSSSSLPLRDDIAMIRALETHLRAQGHPRSLAARAANALNIRSFIRSLPFTQRLRLLFGRREKS